MVPNAPKYYKMRQNMSLGSNGGGSGVFIAKTFDATLRDELLLQFGLYCTEFCKATKWSRMHPNRTKHTKTSVYGAMGGSDAFVVKNSDATLWHDLLH